MDESGLERIVGFRSRSSQKVVGSSCRYIRKRTGPSQLLESANGVEHRRLLPPIPNPRHRLQEVLDLPLRVLSRLVSILLPTPDPLSVLTHHRGTLPLGDAESPASCIELFTKCPRRRVWVVAEEPYDRSPVSDSRARIARFPVPNSVRTDSQGCGRLSLGAPAVEPGALEMVTECREISGIVGTRGQRHCEGEIAKR